MREMKRMTALFLLFFLTLQAAISYGADPAFDWQQFGKELSKKTTGMSPLSKAKYITAHVGQQLHRMHIYRNDRIPDRVGSLQKYWTKDVGSCGYVSEKLDMALRGAGIQSDFVIGQRSLLEMGKHVDVANRNHGAVAVVIEGKVYMFDLWKGATSARSPLSSDFSGEGEVELSHGIFDDAGNGPWNGMPADVWEKNMKDDGYETFQRNYEGSYRSLSEAFSTEIEAWKRQQGAKLNQMKAALGIFHEVTESVEKQVKEETDREKGKNEGDLTEASLKKNPKLWDCVREDYEWYMKAVKISQNPGKWQDGTPISWFRCGPIGADWQMIADQKCCEEFEKHRAEPGAWEALQRCGWDTEVRKRKEQLEKTIQACRDRQARK